MRRYVGPLGAALLVSMLTGCVEQRYVVTTDPPGALVYVNGKAIGASPADGSFLYHGDYEITVVKPGYETLHVRQNISTPWYEYFPLDFISEAIVPWRISDVRRFNYALQPAKAPDVEALRDKAGVLRIKGQSIEVPPEPVEPPRPVPPPPKTPLPAVGPPVISSP